jgi:hypothetical protein
MEKEAEEDIGLLSSLLSSLVKGGGGLFLYVCSEREVSMCLTTYLAPLFYTPQVAKQNVLLFVVMKAARTQTQAIHFCSSLDCTIISSYMFNNDMWHNDTRRRGTSGGLLLL